MFCDVQFQVHVNKIFIVARYNVP